MRLAAELRPKTLKQLLALRRSHGVELTEETKKEKRRKMDVVKKGREKRKGDAS